MLFFPVKKTKAHQGSHTNHKKNARTRQRREGGVTLFFHNAIACGIGGTTTPPTPGFLETKLLAFGAKFDPEELVLYTIPAPVLGFGFVFTTAPVAAEEEEEEEGFIPAVEGGNNRLGSEGLGGAETFLFLC